MRKLEEEDGMVTLVYVANAKAGGITAFGLDMEEGSLVRQAEYATDLGVAPLAVSQDRRFLYAAIRGESAAIASFAIDSATGDLVFLNSVSIENSVHYLTVDATRRFLLTASYGGNTVSVLAIGREGFVQQEPIETLRPGRNPHCILLDQSNRFTYVPLLGSDLVGQFHFNAHTGRLTPNTPPFVAASRETGPRHIVLSPDGRYAYVLMEMGGEIAQYRVDPECGCLTPVHTVTILPPERAYPRGSYTPPVNSTGGPNSTSPVMWAAEIRISPDGLFLYASERTGSTISCFSIDPISGRLDLRHVAETEERPRGFAIDPFGQYLIAAGEASNHVAVYRIDRENGGLTATDRKDVGKEPTWVEIITL